MARQVFEDAMLSVARQVFGTQNVARGRKSLDTTESIDLLVLHSMIVYKLIVPRLLCTLIGPHQLTNESFVQLHDPPHA